MKRLPIKTAQARATRRRSATLAGVSKLHRQFNFATESNHGALVLVDERRDDLDSAGAVEIETPLHRGKECGRAVGVLSSSVNADCDLADLKRSSGECRLEKERIATTNVPGSDGRQSCNADDLKRSIIVFRELLCRTMLVGCGWLTVVNK